MGFRVLPRRGPALRLPSGRQQERLVRLQGRGLALALQLPLVLAEGPLPSQVRPLLQLREDPDRL